MARIKRWLVFYVLYICMCSKLHAFRCVFMSAFRSIGQSKCVLNPAEGRNNTNQTALSLHSLRTTKGFPCLFCMCACECNGDKCISRAMQIVRTLLTRFVRIRKWVGINESVPLAILSYHIRCLQGVFVVFPVKMTKITLMASEISCYSYN